MVVISSDSPLLNNGSGKLGLGELATASCEWGVEDIVGPRHSYRERLMLSLTRTHETSPTAVDIGCGTGSLACALAQKGYRVVAVDYSLGCAERTRGRATSVGIQSNRLETVVAAAQHLPIPDSFADLITCGDVLEHVDDDDAMMKDIVRSMKPGAKGVFTVPADMHRWSVCDTWAGHQRRYSAPALRELFTRHNLEITSLRRWGFPVVELYDRLLFLPYVRRRVASGQRSMGHGSLAGRIVRSGPLVAFGSYALSLDRLFWFANRGSSWLISVRRPTVK